MSGRKARAPCGHTGEVVIGNYVECPFGCKARTEYRMACCNTGPAATRNHTSVVLGVVFVRCTHCQFVHGRYSTVHQPVYLSGINLPVRQYRHSSVTACDTDEGLCACGASHSWRVDELVSENPVQLVIRKETAYCTGHCEEKLYTLVTARERT